MLKITYLAKQNSSVDSRVGYWVMYWGRSMLGQITLQNPTVAPLKIEEVPEDPYAKDGWLECIE